MASTGDGHGQPQLQPPYVVVFDIDDTLLFSLRSPHRESVKEQFRQLVATCHDRGYGVGINTARLWITPRVKRHLRDVLIDVNALPRGAVQRAAINSRLKLKALQKIQAAYGNVPSERVLFFDDKESNVRRALANNFVAVQVDASQPLPHLKF